MTGVAPRGRAATRSDVAALAGVSPAVVSYVLNDGPRPVAKATRARVLAAMGELNYRPNAVARSLRTRRSGILGLIVPDNTNPFFAELAREIEEAAFESGQVLLLGNSAEDPDRESGYVETFLQRQIDGLLLISVLTDPDLGAAIETGTPVLLLDRSSPHDNVSSVVVDNESGAYEGTRHLFSHGHETVACIAGLPTVSVAQQRRSGFLRAVEELTGDPGEAMLLEAPFTRLGGYRAATALLSGATPPTAIFASSDLQGIGALRAAREKGLEVPEDLAVLCFDGTEEAEFTVPALSTVRQPLEDLARTALRRLADGGSARQTTVDVLSPSLVLRASCGCSRALDDSSLHFANLLV